MILPCETCICLAICKAIYESRYQYELGIETPKTIAHIDGKLLLVKRCSIFDEYMSPMFDKEKNVAFCKLFNPGMYPTYERYEG